MSNISSYLEERLKTVKYQIDRLTTSQNSLDDEIEAISEKQRNISENVDVTYKLFSPKPVSSKESRESVQILEVKKYELMSQKKRLEEQIQKLNIEQKKIENSMTDLKKMEIFINKVVNQYNLSQP